jgi:Cu/Ag efflux pump CusA
MTHRRAPVHVTYPCSGRARRAHAERRVGNGRRVGIALLLAGAERVAGELTRAEVVRLAVGPRLPAGAGPTLGPAAMAVGWVYQCAVIDDTHQLGFAHPRQLQEAALNAALQSTPGAAEIATVGGDVEQIKVPVDPALFLAHGGTLEQVGAAVVRANVPAGGGSIEVAGYELMIRPRAEARSPDDPMDPPISGARDAPATVSAVRTAGPAPTGATVDTMGVMGRTSSSVSTPAPSVGGGASSTHVVRVRDVADVPRAPAPWRGVADFDGLIETTGGVVWRARAATRWTSSRASTSGLTR